VSATNSDIIVVSGLPRSGTSMMMQLLQAAGIEALTDGIRQADENNPRGYYELEVVKQTSNDASWLIDAGGKAIKVIYRLLYDLPGDQHYRTIFMQRPMAEVVRSQQAMLKQLGQQGSDLSDADLGALLHKELVTVNQWLSTNPAFDVLYVGYHQVLNTPEMILARISQFLGRNLHVDQINQVIEPRLCHNRELEQ